MSIQAKSTELDRDDGITVTLPEFVVEALEEIARYRNVSLDKALLYAISTEKYIGESMQKGAKLFLKEKGQVTELNILSMANENNAPLQSDELKSLLPIVLFSYTRENLMLQFSPQELISVGNSRQ
jgi:hypothetical protein